MVVLTCPNGQYAGAMAKVKAKIPPTKFSKMGIESLKLKRAATGALILQVPEPQGADRADTLAAVLRTVPRMRSESLAP